MTDHTAEAALDAEVDEPATKTESYDVVEYGLVLPDGNVSWSQWLGRPFSTVLDRVSIIELLKRTAAQVGFPEDDFLSRYGWTSREVTMTKTYRDEPITLVSLTDPSIFPSADE